MEIKKFKICDTENIKSYYNTYGYVVLENLLDNDRINLFLSTYEEIKRNPFFVYYSQSVHRPLRPRITAEGYIEESMQNATQLKFFSRFSGAMLNCLVDQNISRALSILSGASSHAIYQNMFFDKSTGTIEHQDHYYLDTIPSGHLIGTWYALENIHPEAGCFFVLPSSHLGTVIEREKLSNHHQSVAKSFSDHDLMMEKIQSLIQEGTYEYRSFPLCKGDVLFWHPYTIHGAYSCKNSKYSRKSFTAHFGPAHLDRLYARKPSRVQPSNNPDIFVDQDGFQASLDNIKLYIKYFLGNVTARSKVFMDMRRISYKK